MKRDRALKAQAVTAARMQELDRRATEIYGIPSLLLMENAGRGTADLVQGDAKLKRVLIFCGKGNNGGDGLVIGRHLTNRGFSVQFLLLADPLSLKDDPRINFQIAERMKIPIAVMGPASGPGDFEKYLRDSDLVIDALFGIGLNASLREPYVSAIEAMNGSQKKIMAVDIPSGLHADTGEVMGIAVKAAVTATLALPKKGLFAGDGPGYSGEIRVVDIGLPRELLMPDQV